MNFFTPGLDIRQLAPGHGRSVSIFSRPY